MGCYPLSKMMSKALRRRKGRKRHRVGRTMVYSPPPTYITKTVTFCDDSPVVVVLPEPTQVAPPFSKGHPATVVAPSAQAEMIQPRKHRCVRFAPGPDEPEEMRTFDAVMASPAARWEEGERRREYFGGEYQYYPTPVREGIYRIATDVNRLTTMFSEENPNACSII